MYGMQKTSSHRAWTGFVLSTGVALLVAPGCKSPFVDADTQAFQAALAESYRMNLEASGAGELIEVTRSPSEVDEQLTAERIDELEAISGPDAYEDVEIDPGQNLTGTQTQIVRLSLEDAVRLTVENSLDLAIARLIPAVSATQVTRAEAAFDAVFFASADYQNIDTPVPGTAFFSGQSESLTLRTGVRQPLTSGGTFAVETGLSNQRNPSQFGTPSFYTSDLTFSLNQPLLRGFGEEVNTANIALARNARRADIQQLRQTLLQLSADVESAYWNLRLAHQSMRIQARLLERTIEQRDKLEPRLDFDVTPSTLAEVNARIGQRRADLIRARADVRAASDALKRLLNSPDLPLADERVILPAELPIMDPIQFSLLDAVTTALRERPEIQTALLDIQDGAIRQRVADNNLLPTLDLQAALRLQGLSLSDGGDSYSELTEGDFIDYILQVNFEQPIGNRDARALVEQRRLESQAQVIAYQRTAQDVVLEVKNALRAVLTSYELIGATRDARISAAESLRAINVQEEEGVPLTPEFINLQLNRQEQLASTELAESQAQIDYNNALAELYRVMGTLLERNHIGFEDPQAE